MFQEFADDGLTLIIILIFIFQEFADDGLINIVGGCCGTTPTHIKLVLVFIGNSVFQLSLQVLTKF